MNSVLILKLVAIALLIIIPLIVCSITMFQNLKKQTNPIFSYFNFFAGGIFLAICILDILPEA